MGIYNSFTGRGYKPPPKKGVLRRPPAKGVTRTPSSGAGPGAGAPSPGAPPFDPALEARRAALEARRATLLSDADVDMQQTAQQYGFTYNPATGAFGGFDPTNPFSQAALLAKTRDESFAASKLGYERRSAAGRQGLAQAGQLYAGATQNAQQEENRVYGKQKTDIQFGYDRGYDTLRRGFDDYVKNYLRRKRDISTVDINELATL